MLWRLEALLDVGARLYRIEEVVEFLIEFAWTRCCKHLLLLDVLDVFFIFTADLSNLSNLLPLGPKLLPLALAVAAFIAFLDTLSFLCGVALLYRLGILIKPRG